MPDKQPETLTDPESGELIPQKEQPGYYPGFSTLAQQAYWDGATRELVLQRMTAAPAIRFFTPEEAVTMDAVFARLLPQDDRTPDRRIPILPSIDERLYLNKIEGYRYEDMPSDQQAYRLAAEAIDKMAQHLHRVPFPKLATLDQERILQSIHDAEPQAAQDVWKQMNIERFWTMLLSDCAAAYYSHPWGWDEIGFGGPAYPRGYMRLEEGEPEPWEVDEVRYEWAAPADTLSDKEKAHGKGHEHQSHQGQGGTH